MSTAAVLVIGNEILSGKIREANTYELARVLRELGVELRRIVVVPDERERIAAEVRELSASHAHVFTSGGIGPTHDDVTIAGITHRFGSFTALRNVSLSIGAGAFAVLLGPSGCGKTTTMRRLPKASRSRRTDVRRRRIPATSRASRRPDGG